MKRFALPLMLALTMSVSAVPAADAGPFTDAAKKLAQASRQAVGIVALKGACAVDRLRGKGGGFLCGGKLFDNRN